MVSSVESFPRESTLHRESSACAGGGGHDSLIGYHDPIDRGHDPLTSGHNSLIRESRPPYHADRVLGRETALCTMREARARGRGFKSLCALDTRSSQALEPRVQ